MTGPRYTVALVHGDFHPWTGNPHATPQLSAHVLDRLNAHRVVATRRSEDTQSPGLPRYRPGAPKRLGGAGAVAAATALADEWNADEGFPNRRPPVKVAPDEP